MTFNAAAISALFSAIVSQADQLGVFERSLGHEPKSAPGAKLSFALWLDSIEPLPGASGLAAVSGRVAFMARIYKSFASKPEDDIDPELLAAQGAFMGAVSGDFTLGGLVRNVDLLGEHGTPLSAQAAYLEQDGKVYRVLDVTIPVIINDLWSEAA